METPNTRQQLLPEHVHMAQHWVSDGAGAAVQGSLPACILPSPPLWPAGNKRGCVTGQGEHRDTSSSWGNALISPFPNMGVADSFNFLFIFFSYMKGTWKPHCIFLNFKMTSWVGGELLLNCAVLRLTFSSKPKASIYCSLPHLKLVPLLMAGAKGKRQTCLGLVCC